MTESNKTTTAGHTPGPWTLDPRAYLCIRGGKDFLVANCGGRTNNFNTDALYQEQAANARLIAAAPDMLEALQMVSKCLRDGTPVRCGGYVNAAIALATTGTPS